MPNCSGKNVRKKSGGGGDFFVSHYILNDVTNAVGEEDSISINWMFLYKGEAKRCQCGNWFKLVELDTSKHGGQH